MNENSNFNLQVVPGDFTIKYGSKTLKHPWSISKKNLRPFQNYILKIQWDINFLTFSNTDRPTPKQIWNSNYISLY